MNRRKVRRQNQLKYQEWIHSDQYISCLERVFWTLDMVSLFRAMRACKHWMGIIIERVIKPQYKTPAPQYFLKYDYLSIWYHLKILKQANTSNMIEMYNTALQANEMKAARLFATFVTVWPEIPSFIKIAIGGTEDPRKHVYRFDDSYACIKFCENYILISPIRCKREIIQILNLLYTCSEKPTLQLKFKSLIHILERFRIYQKETLSASDYDNILANI